MANLLILLVDTEPLRRPASEPADRRADNCSGTCVARRGIQNGAGRRVPESETWGAQ